MIKTFNLLEGIRGKSFFSSKIIIIIYALCLGNEKELMELNVNDRVQQFNNCDKKDDRGELLNISGG